MKAGVFYGIRDIRFADVPDLQLEPGDKFDVLIKVKAAGVCGSDIHFYEGTLPSSDHIGKVLGHELAGEVVAVGGGVSNVKPGDRVAVEPLIGCGTCVYCRAGDYHLCKDLRHIGYYYSGGFGEYSKAPHEKVFKIPDNMSYETATLLDGYAVAVHSVNRSKLSIADFVVVFGAGPLGICIAQVARAAGARDVVIIDTIDEVLEIAKSAGLEKAWNSAKIDVKEEIFKLTGGRGCDIVFVARGGTSPLIEPAIDLLRPNGYLGLVGLRNRIDFEAVGAHFKEIMIDFNFSYAMWNYITEFEIALGLLARGDIDAEPLVTHVLPLAEIDKAFQITKNKLESKAVKVVVKPV